MRVQTMSIFLLLGFATLQSCRTSNMSSEKDIAGSPGFVEMKFVTISAGTFMMGSPDSELGRSRNEGPQHQVKLTKGFEMQTTEVTQSQWVSVMGSNPSYFQKNENCPGEFTNANGLAMCPNNPVEKVSWDEAKAFIEKLNAKADGHRYRLPTEAEWEYAARAGTTGPYAGDLDAMAWYDANSGRMTHPVAKKQANSVGLYDIHGNVYQWVSDGFDDYSSSQGTDPKGASSGLIRVVRGCSWINFDHDCRTANRGSAAPDKRESNVGFRLVRTSP